MPAAVLHEAHTTRPDTIPVHRERRRAPSLPSAWPVAGLGEHWLWGDCGEVVVVAAGDVGEAAADIEGAVGRYRQGGDFAAGVDVGPEGGEGSGVGGECGQADVPLELEEVA